MRRALVVGLVVVGLCSASGCGDKPEDLVDRQITLLRELAGEMDDATRREKEAQLKENALKLTELKLSEEQKRAIREKMRAEIREAAETLAKRRGVTDPLAP